jgi:phage tail-like protein
MTAAVAHAGPTPLPVRARMPNLTGRPLAQARAMLAGAGLRRVVVLYRDSYDARDTVVDQRPASGQLADPTGEIALWVARRSYLAQLPALYRRSDAAGNDLVRALCWVFQHLHDSVAARIDDGWRAYDPRTAPSALLDWLARWTAFAMETEWGEPQRRALLARAVELYRVRGTRRGLALYLELFTGVAPTIVEGVWPLRALRVVGEDGDAGRIGVDAAVLPSVDRARCFVVAMPIARDAIPPELVARIHRIIAAEKPAHTHYCLQFAAPASPAPPDPAFAIGLRIVDGRPAPEPDPDDEDRA